MSSRDAIGAPTMPGKHEGRHVLLVEDTRLFSIIIRERLESLLGLRVTLCETFQAMQQELAEAPDKYSLVILDLVQPDAGEGIALDHALSRKIRTVVFTGVSSDEKRARVLATGLADYVAKSAPRAIDLLVEVVDRRLSASNARVVYIHPEGEDSEVGRMLVQSSFLPVVARSEREALDAIDQQGNIELVLVPSDAAARRNYRFLETLRDRYGEDALGVVAYSAAPEPDEAARFLRAGGDDFFRLPISPEELAGRIEHLLNLHQRIRALQRMASRDYLTDLFNRRYFFDRGPKLVEKCLRQKKPVSMALMDIDHFKKLNDRHGHGVGDIVLKAVAKKLSVIFSNNDHLVARLGGEEFGMLFVDLDPQQAMRFCEEIRSEIAEVRIVVDDDDISITVSVGHASITGAESFENYLNAADQYLYLAKHSGRNRVFSDCQVSQIMAS